ncbi:hypothetical protein M406DRAFT_334416 [Cryphonectria parasitica EP155]|uniref:Uncharacterized protein n=1 Tax=Cryphonectria parasitica (strain ATCC 38755 / EP155) TaxID=660469 RepID=A0A9P4XTS3_CRYP1|nr:uncharacterized protein M406DRAFT_334416 [Cryphonectria parasitica EP155]KAF3760798.1 hypothetical protein M406DRAFT_334416 [Cryphonectria parasitica EP155]
MTKMQGKSEMCSKAVAKKKSPVFHKFTELSAELRLLIIGAALDEDRKHRPTRVVLLDPTTRRISPTVDLGDNPSPLLFVNMEFREAALETYVRLSVLDLGYPDVGQYGNETDWYDGDGCLRYVPAIAQQIDREAERGKPRVISDTYLVSFSPLLMLIHIHITPYSKHLSSHDMTRTRTDQRHPSVQGGIYLDVKKDIFIIGSTPRQILETGAFQEMCDCEEGPWCLPAFRLTEKLPFEACAEVVTMRELTWDPARSCTHCGTYHPPRSDKDFFMSRGHIPPLYDAAIFSSVSAFGYYIMSGDVDPEQFLFEVTALESADFLKEWSERFYKAVYLNGKIVA